MAARNDNLVTGIGLQEKSIELSYCHTADTFTTDIGGLFSRNVLRENDT